MTVLVRLILSDCSIVLNDLNRYELKTDRNGNVVIKARLVAYRCEEDTTIRLVQK